VAAVLAVQVELQLFIHVEKEKAAVYMAAVLEVLLVLIAMVLVLEEPFVLFGQEILVNFHQLAWGHHEFVH
jgi:cytochrome c oxidase subunit IV